jgi:hypothetical protein
VNEDVLDLRHGGIALVLESWRSDVQPCAAGANRHHRRRRTTGSCAPAGGSGWSWSGSPSYPAAGDLAREIRELEGSALSIVGAPGPRPQRLGQLRGRRRVEGVVCGAPIRYRTGDRVLVCAWCSYTYEQQDFITLHDLQPREAEGKEAS